MATKLERRALKVRVRTKLKKQRRKIFAPTRGVTQSLQEQNRAILNKVEAIAREQAK